MMLLKLAWRMFWRDWKSGELRVLMIALLIAIGGLSSVTFLVDRVDRGMTKEASQVLGADRLLSSPRPADSIWLNKAAELSLETSQILWFSSVVIAGEEFQLSSIRAVDKSFPLAGELEISDKPFQKGTIRKGHPAKGTVWVSSRLLQLLNIEMGQSLQVGVREFRVTGVIINEPGGSSFFNFAPTVMMALDDVESTEIIQPGSRLNYRLAFAGSEAALSALDEWSEKELDSSQKYLKVESGAPALGSALGRAKKYLSLSGLLGLLLGGIAIAIAANRYAGRHFDHSALLRCLGLKKNQVLALFCMVLVIAGLVGSIGGIVIGLLCNQALILSLASLLPETVPAPRFVTAGISLATGMLVLVGFALPAMLKIRNVAPMRILRRDLEPFAVQQWAVILIATAALSFILYVYTQDWRMVLGVVLGGAILISISLALAMMLLKIARTYSKTRSISFRFGVEHLNRYKSATLIQISAFGLTLSLLLIIFIIRNELISDWQKQMPEDAPNHFLVNLRPEKVPNLNQFFDENKVKSSPLFPMTRGRVTHINAQNPSDILNEKQLSHNTLQRDLNITWANEFPTANTLIQGDWQMSEQSTPVISVESKMAEALSLSLGDELTFNIGGEAITAKINSIRDVKWDSFQPNFYVIFDDKSILNAPVTYMTSFYLSPSQKLLLNDMVHQFPTVSVIELDLILSEVRKIIAQASLIIEVVLVFVILAGIAVLMATTHATLDEKRYESAILKTLGASKQLIRKTTFVQYSVLAILAGLMAVLTSQGIALVLYKLIFKMDLTLHFWLWIVAPLTAFFIVVPAGMIGNRRVLSEPPSTTLRDV